MIEFIQKYWTYIVAFGTVVAYLFDKGRNIWVETKKKKTAYNRVFTSVTKLYFSYIKHKTLYSEESPFNFPDEIYSVIVKHIDTFNSDLDEFKLSVDKESEVIPEIIIQTHILFDTIDRMRVMDKMKSSGVEEVQEMTERENIAIKRAQFHALEEIFKEFFQDIITDIQKHTTVKKSFVKNLFYFESDEYFKEAEEEQRKIMRRYYESLNRQGLLPDEIFNALIQEMNL